MVNDWTGQKYVDEYNQKVKDKTLLQLEAAPEKKEEKKEEKKKEFPKVAKKETKKEEKKDAKKVEKKKWIPMEEE